MSAVTAREAAEMRRRHDEGQTVNYIADAMGRSWTSVNRYVHRLSWVETRTPRRSPEQHLEYFRVMRAHREHLRRLHEAIAACQEYL
jgi:hypothetical protein